MLVSILPGSKDLVERIYQRARVIGVENNILIFLSDEKIPRSPNLHFHTGMPDPSLNLSYSKFIEECFVGTNALVGEIGGLAKVNPT